MTSDIARFFVTPCSSLRGAMRVIDQGAVQIALVVDDNQKLLGTLSDGDIRRALLSGASLDSSVDKFMNSNYRFVRSNENYESILAMMRRDVLRQIPVLDEMNRVVQLILLHELLDAKQIQNPVVIMAGGKGTRLRPYTENCPKPMLPVGDKPMLEILLDQCISSGFHSFFFSVNYLKEQIIDYFGDGSKWGVSINYLIENQPLGTAGSLRLLPDSLKDPFLVLNGDVLTRLDSRRLMHFHYEHDSKATLCVREHEFNVPFGVVDTDGVQFAGIREKPTFRYQANAGVYVIDPALLTLLPHHQPTDMPTLLMSAQSAGFRVSVCPIHEYWLDIGRPETLKQAHRDWPPQPES